jgi:hypothetical protein
LIQRKALPLAAVLGHPEADADRRDQPRQELPKKSTIGCLEKLV